MAVVHIYVWVCGLYGQSEDGSLGVPGGSG